jgi:hypothetical protein
MSRQTVVEIAKYFELLCIYQKDRIERTSYYRKDKQLNFVRLEFWDKSKLHRTQFLKTSLLGKLRYSSK